MKNYDLESMNMIKCYHCFPSHPGYLGPSYSLNTHIQYHHDSSFIKSLNIYFLYSFTLSIFIQRQLYCTWFLDCLFSANSLAYQYQINFPKISVNVLYFYSHQGRLLISTGIKSKLTWPSCADTASCMQHPFSSNSA